MRAVPAGDDFDGWVGLLAVSQLRQRAKHHLVMAGPAVLPALRRGLGHREATVRRVCTAMLDRLVDDDTLPDLVAALDDDDSAVCARALHALACDRCKENACRPGEDLFVPRAIDFVRHHPDPDVRAAAIDALGKVAGHRSDAAAALEAASTGDADRGLRSLSRRQLELVRRARVTTG